MISVWGIGESLIDDYFDLKQRVTEQKNRIDDLANKFKELKNLLKHKVH